MERILALIKRISLTQWLLFFIIVFLYFDLLELKRINENISGIVTQLRWAR
jgi:hypothetical protein